MMVGQTGGAGRGWSGLVMEQELMYLLIPDPDWQVLAKALVFAVMENKCLVCGKPKQPTDDQTHQSSLWKQVLLMDKKYFPDSAACHCRPRTLSLNSFGHRACGGVGAASRPEHGPSPVRCAPAGGRPSIQHWVNKASS